MSNEIALFTKDLALHERQFKSVLPAHIPSQKFLRTIVGAVQNNPRYLVVARRFAGRARRRARRPDSGRSRGGYRPVQRLTAVHAMVAGLLKKLHGGQISTITAQTVHEKDKFAYNPANDDVPDPG